MSSDNGSTEIDALQSIVNALSQLPKDTQQRILNSVAVFLDLTDNSSTATNRDFFSQNTTHDTDPSRYQFVGREDMSPKQFLAEKIPQTDVDRVACLAFYLTHYRDTPQFKTLDISTLNREAAQMAFSNTAKAVSNAAQRGFLAPAGKGKKQITTIGESYVSELPNVESARAAAKARAPKRKKVKPKSKPPRTDS